MQRRAIVGALLLIGVGVILGATVLRAGIAHATGYGPSTRGAGLDKTVTKVAEQNLDGNNIRVHEEGTATVQEAGTPWTKSLSSSNNTDTSFTVPADKRLVIQYCSGFYQVDSGFSPIGFLRPHSSAGNSLQFDFLGTVLPNAISRYEFAQQVTIYADPGSTVVWNFPGSGNGFIELSGYLLPA